MYKKVDVVLSDVVPGEELAEDLIFNGNCLLKAGNAISKKLIANLTGKGVKSVVIHRKIKLGVERKQELLDDLNRHLDEVFALSGNDETMQLLRQLVWQYRIKEID